MAFFSLQAGQQIYILNKDSVPALSVGTVVSVSQPRPSPKNWQQTVVTLVAEIGGESRTLENLPSDRDMADSMTGVQVYCSRDLALGEIQRMRDASARVVADIDRHKAVVKACDGILCELSPEIAERAERERELGEMRAQMSEMREMLRMAMSGNSGQAKNDKHGKDTDTDRA